MTDKQSIDRWHFLATGGTVFISAMAGCVHIQDHLQGIFGNDSEAADRVSRSTSVDKCLSDTDNYTGSFYYYCDPHQKMGMKGAVIVADSTNAGQLSTDRAQLEGR